MYWVDSKVSKDMQKIFVKIPGSSSCLLIRNYEMLKSTILASGSTSYSSVLFWIRLQILSSLLFEVNEVDKVEFKRSFRGCERLEDWHVLSGRKIYLTKQQKIWTNEVTSSNWNWDCKHENRWNETKNIYPEKQWLRVMLGMFEVFTCCQLSISTVFSWIFCRCMLHEIMWPSENLLELGRNSNWQWLFQGHESRGFLLKTKTKIIY